MSVQDDKRLEWLDEQRRKDADTLSRLERRLAALEETLASQTRQLQDLATETARLAALATRIHQVDDALGKHRQEVSRQLEAAEEARTQKERQIAQARERELAETSRTLTRLRDDLSVLDEVREAFVARREEETRITRSIEALSRRVEELAGHDEARARWIVSAEENSKIDHKRLSDLQAESGDLRTRVETARGTIDTVEDRLRRAEVRVAEIAAADNERREALTLWMEQQNMRQVDFDRTAREWGRRFEGIEHTAAELDARLLAYEETYRALRQQREELDALMERLERRIAEVGEMQRLTEDRLKQEWAGFQGEDQKRWNAYKLSRDELWREHNRLHERIARELEALESGVTTSLRGFGELSESSQQHILGLLALVREWAAEAERRAREPG